MNRHNSIIEQAKQTIRTLPTHKKYGCKNDVNHMNLSGRIQIDQSDVWRSKFKGNQITGPFRVSNSSKVSYPSLEGRLRFD